MVQHQDAVGLLHRSQPMCNHQRGTSLHRRLQRRLHHALALGVECAGGFIQQQQRRVLEHGTGNRNTLALSTGQAHPALAQKSVIAFGQSHDELMRKRSACCGLYLVVAGLWFAVTDVLQRTARKNHSVLRHDADALPQLKQRHVGRPHTIEFNAARSRIVKTQQQLEHRAFASATGAHDRHSFARLHRQ